MRRHPHKPLYILASGGTGGHLFPALSLCEKLKQYGRRVFLITDQRSKNFNNLQNFDQVYVRTMSHRAPVIGRGILYLSLLWQTLYCYWLYRKIQPTLVVGFGGYPSIPPVLAAQLRGIPTIIHEQNALLGKANRFLAKRAYRVATSFQSSEKTLLHTTFTGNPIRAEIAALNAQPYIKPETNQPFHILVTGGSQGARIFSDVVPQALIRLPLDLQRRLSIVQQCRPEFMARTKVTYRQSFLDVHLTSFITDIAAEYQKAHLVIARSGASTVAELAATKKPSILVPYAASLEADQMNNSEPLRKAGAAWVFKEDDFTPEALASLLENLMKNPDLLVNTSRNIEKFSKLDATQALANTVAEVIGDLLISKE